MRPCSAALLAGRKGLKLVGKEEFEAAVLRSVAGRAAHSSTLLHFSPHPEHLLWDDMSWVVTLVHLSAQPGHHLWDELLGGFSDKTVTKR